MSNNKKQNINLDNNNSKKEFFLPSSNPLKSKAVEQNTTLVNYTKTTQRPKFDEDIASTLEIVRILNNLAPIRMPIYNFNINEINGDYYYKPDGSLLFIREDDGDIISANQCKYNA